MTTTSLPSTADRRPTPTSRVWAGGRVLAEDLSGEDLAEVLHLHAKASAWWVITEDDDDQLRQVAFELGLDDGVVAELLHHSCWIGYTDLDQVSVVGLDAARWVGDGTVAVHPLGLIITDQLVICLVHRRSGPDDFSPARVWTDQIAQLADGGVEAAVAVLTTAVLDSYTESLRELQTAADKLADVIFDERPLSRTEQIDGFRLRKVLSTLRRLFEPTGEAIETMADSPRRAEELKRRWAKLVHRQDRQEQLVIALQENLNSVFQTSLSLNDERANQIMKKLTGWAAIIAVPTLVTGFVGMNVNFPLHDSTAGFWVYLVIMVVPVVLLFVAFKRRDWI